MTSQALLHFQMLPDGSSLAVPGGQVLQYLDAPPPSFVPQPAGRRGVVGVAALSWPGVDHAPVAIVDVLFALNLTARLSSLGALLLVRGLDGAAAGLITSERLRPPRYEVVEVAAPPLDWESHPEIGNVLRQCPQPSVTGQTTWLLDAPHFFTRLCHS